MSRERMTEFVPGELSRIRRMNRVRQARRTRRVRGLFLAVVLMIVLTPYAGHWAVQRTTAWSMSGQKNLSFTDEELEGLAADVLGGIVRDGMTQLEQARAVFDYVHDHIAYTGQSDKSDWKSGAYTGLTTGKGDCFTYYAVSRALLTALGIDNLTVERTGGETQHYWNLVNCGGGWYHFDACPRSSKLPPFRSFMFTDRQAADFTAAAGRNYYDFDGSLLPERAAEVLTEN